MTLIRWPNRHPMVFPLCLPALLAGTAASVLLDLRPGLLLCGGLLALWAALRFYYGAPRSLCLTRELAALLPRYASLPARRKLPLACTAVIVHCSAGNWAQARPFLEDLEKLIAQLPRGRGWRTWQRGLESLRLVFRLGTEGGSEELLSAFSRQLSAATDRYEQVSAHANLARCLLDLDRRDEARPHLAFIAENGGTLAIRAEASARLAALSPAEN